MKPLTDLQALLKGLEPVLDPHPYAYARLDILTETLCEIAFATFREEEGVSIIALLDDLETLGLEPIHICRRITLSVHSALEAVGLTASIAQALSERGISANVVAALHHDHVFVAEDRAQDALEVLQALSRAARS